MLYYLFEILEKEFQLMGASLFQYISFRSAISFILGSFNFNNFWEENNKLFKTKTNR